MPLRSKISDQAQQDINGIVAYISADNEAAALRVHQAIHEHIDRICGLPTLGDSVESPKIQGVRYSAVSKFRKYGIFFRQENGIVQVLRVLHSAQDFQRELEEPRRQAGERLVVLVKDCPMAFRWCPAGTFTMGSPSSETGRRNDEQQHTVTLTRGFWLGETQVTEKQWHVITGKNPSNCNFKGSQWPVGCVSWNDCQAFVAQLNELNIAPSGFRFSLPTEAQWEYACRAGSTTAYCFGDNWQQLPDFAFFNGFKNDEERYKADTQFDSEWGDVEIYWGFTPHSVGQKQANAWGLYDMHGNVCEWCLDWYGVYPSGAVTDPSGASDPSGVSDPSGASVWCRVIRGLMIKIPFLRRVLRGGRYRDIADYTSLDAIDRKVCRGGCCGDIAENCRSAYRDGNPPENRDSDLGVRVALVPSK
ncbi:MAG: SUMF1/EgtB/PvdO family nonheme iron enzyme [Planctomycetaceae bacterium]|jgi:formylglycine-generating enzyme required for sulfatase activity/plasmid stabilization system protein ParE|nr:SUMF1/EgtB/PvdO family nonheme iron enzyme [Planctomycetaceae bacterium]